MDEKDMQSTLERASLLQDRWYLIFKEGDSDDHVSMTAYDTTEEDEDDDGNEFGGVTELELDKIAEMMDKPEDTMETANAILGSLMESTDNDLGRFLEDLVAQTEHGNTKEINKLPTPKKRLLLKEDQKAVNQKETNR